MTAKRTTIGTVQYLSGRGGGSEKLELSSKNLDSTPLQNKKI